MYAVDIGSSKLESLCNDRIMMSMGKRLVRRVGRMKKLTLGDGGF
jgi:hypothetical protein